MSDVLLNEKAEDALCMLERENAFHDEKNRRILEQQRAYEGILERTKPAAEWESKLHPPLINHAIETAMKMSIRACLQGLRWHPAPAGTAAPPC